MWYVRDLFLCRCMTVRAESFRNALFFSMFQGPPGAPNMPRQGGPPGMPPPPGGQMQGPPRQANQGPMPPMGQPRMNQGPPQMSQGPPAPPPMNQGPPMPPQQMQVSTYMFGDDLLFV